MILLQWESLGPPEPWIVLCVSLLVVGIYIHQRKIPVDCHGVHSQRIVLFVKEAKGDCLRVAIRSTVGTPLTFVIWKKMSGFRNHSPNTCLITYIIYWIVHIIAISAGRKHNIEVDKPLPSSAARKGCQRGMKKLTWNARQGACPFVQIYPLTVPVFVALSSKGTSLRTCFHAYSSLEHSRRTGWLRVTLLLLYSVLKVDAESRLLRPIMGP